MILLKNLLTWHSKCNHSHYFRYRWVFYK